MAKTKRPAYSPAECVRWLTLQIDGVVRYATAQDSELNAEEMGELLSSLKRGEMRVSSAFSALLDKIDDGRAA